MTGEDLLLTLPNRGWEVVRLEHPWPIWTLLILGWVKATRSGPGKGVYQVRLTGAGRRARAGILDNRQGMP